MTASRFHDRVRDLLTDAEEHAARLDWEAVRDLATATLTLAPDSEEAQRLLRQADAADPSYGERRQLTVMFCDVVGSTAMSQRSDPEVVREVLRGYQAACDAVVRRYEGKIAAYSGDGVLVYFGVPAAHEDDAHRAVRAGLDILEALHPVIDEARDAYDIDLGIRVAVHTGLVVRADMGSPAAPDRDAVVGEAPNLAARLQDHAVPGTLIISQATYDLVRGWFLVTPLGPLELRGIAEPVEAYRVLEETVGVSRIEVQSDLSPFVGRVAESAALQEAWDTVRQGGAATLVISGEAGVGKTRLVDMVRRRAQDEGHTTLVAHCSSYRRSSVLFPVRRLIESSAGIDPGHAEDNARSRLWTMLDTVAMTDALPVIADLLGIPPEDWSPLTELDGQRLREELLASLVTWVQRLAEGSPTVVVLDDAQWADPTSMDLITRIAAMRVPGLLLVLTARAETKCKVPGATVIDLERLSTDELAELAARLPGGRSLSADELKRLAERSDGIPLFLEELIRSSALSSSDGSIPGALRDLLLARFAAPGADLRLAQAVATVGVEADRPMVADCLELPIEDVDRHLAGLVDAGILVSSGDGFRFRHQLLADFAYESQLLDARRRMHDKVACSLERSGDADPAVLAEHLERAERFGDAVAALTRAAEAAQTLGAFDEAGNLLDRAIGLLHAVDPDQRAAVEFQARLRRGMNTASRFGYAAPQVVTDFEVAIDLVPVIHPEDLDDREVDRGRGAAAERLWSVSGLWATLMLQGRLDEADEVYRGVAAQLSEHSAVRAYLEASEAFTSFFRGAFDEAATGLRQTLALERTFERPRILSIPNDPVPTAMAHLALTDCLQGRVAAGRAQSDEARALAAALPFPHGPFSLCYVEGMRVAIEFTMGDMVAGARHTKLTGEVAERHGYVFWTMVSGVQEATLDLLDRVPGASDRAANLLAILRSLGLLVWQPCWLAGLALGHQLVDEPDPALELLDVAQQIADDTGAHFWTAEIHRLRGELLLAAAPDDPDGFELLRTAADLAAHQGATLFELRARTSLCRLRATAEPAARAADDDKALAALVERAEVDEDLAELAEARAVLAELPG